jgi:hypothetical protein
MKHCRQGDHVARPWELLMPTWLEGTLSQLWSPHPAIVYFPAVLLHQTRLLNRAISAFHSCHLINGLDRLMDLSLNYWDGRLEKRKRKVIHTNIWSQINWFKKKTRYIVLRGHDARLLDKCCCLTLKGGTVYTCRAQTQD